MISTSDAVASCRSELITNILSFWQSLDDRWQFKVFHALNRANGAFQYLLFMSGSFITDNFFFIKCLNKREVVSLEQKHFKEFYD